jgi:hypothetical protein
MKHWSRVPNGYLTPREASFDFDFYHDISSVREDIAFVNVVQKFSLE